MGLVAESQAGGKTIKCTSCGTDIPVRTFKAGNVHCQNCRATRNLDDDLASRMRKFQAEAQAQAASQAAVVDPVVGSDVTAGKSNNGMAIWIVVGLAVLGGVAWALLSGA